MTENGTFIINGAERVVVSQLVRSPGIYFVTERSPSSNRNLCMAKLIPSGAHGLEFETSNKDVLSVKVDRKRKVSASTFLRALGVAYDDQITALFDEIDFGRDPPLYAGNAAERPCRRPCRRVLPRRGPFARCGSGCT